MLARSSKRSSTPSARKPDQLRISRRVPTSTASNSCRMWLLSMRTQPRLDGSANLNPVRPRRSMDPKLAAAIAVKSDVAITNRAAGSAQLPPLTRLMGHIDRIDLLVEDGEFPFWGGGFGISDRHRPGPKVLLAPHEGDLSLAEVKHDARRMSGLPQGQLNRFSSKTWSNRPRQQASQQRRHQRPLHEMHKTHWSQRIHCCEKKSSSGLGAELFRISLVSWSRPKTRLRPPSALLSHERAPSQSKDLRCC